MMEPKKSAKCEHEKVRFLRDIERRIELSLYYCVSCGQILVLDLAPEIPWIQHKLGYLYKETPLYKSMVIECETGLTPTEQVTEQG